MFSGPKAGFDRNLEKATSQLLLEPDWDATLQVCDAIRQQDITAKYALSQVKRKLQDKNPRVGLYALQVLESAMKNCGNSIHEEVATGPFMSEMKDLVNSPNDALKGKAKELLQAWAHAFRDESKLKIVVDTYNQMKTEGQSFPELKESDAMFVAEKAPEWVDGDRCFNCRAEFGVIQRKHHCRHCGQVFCGKCSSKENNIPKFGIERPVRVCDPCHGKLTGKGGPDAPATSSASDLPAEYLNSPLSQQPQVPQKKSEQEVQEEEELQLAMALSLDEAQNKHIIKNEKSKSGSTTSAPSAPSSTYSAPAPQTSAPAFEQELDPELARYLNRNYWESKHEQGLAAGTAPSAPGIPATAPPLSQATSSDPSYAQSNQLQAEVQQNGDDDEQQFIRAMSGSIDVLVNRMKSDSSRGRSIASDTTVQGLFQTLHHMHPRLLKMMQDREEKRAQMEALQDKLAQIRDAREALDALREEHREKLKREAEEAERQRQIQMAQKLEVMRRKKQEMLQMQQQKALMRMQEQERERQIWLEQQRQQMQMRQTRYTFMPQGVPHGQQYVPQEYGSPSHMPYGSQPQQGYPGGVPSGVIPGGQPPSGYQPGMYHQPPPPQGQPLPQGQHPPAPGPQAPLQSQQTPPPPGHQGPPQGHMPPPQGQQYPPGGGYTPLSSMDYQAGGPPSQHPYSMQGMQSALPPSQPPQQQNIPHPHQPHYQPPATGVQYGGAPQTQPPMQGQPMGYQPQGGMYHGGPMQGGQVPPQQPQVQEKPEETLISFD